MRRHVQLAQLLVERIPIAIPQRRRFLAAVLERIGVEQATGKAQLLDAALKLGNHVRNRIAGRLRQAADAEEGIRK